MPPSFKFSVMQPEVRAGPDLTCSSTSRSPLSRSARRALCPAPAEVAGTVCSSSLLPVRARRRGAGSVTRARARLVVLSL